MRLFLCTFLLPFISLAQFAPPVGQPGTTAMSKDSSAFVGWVTMCKVVRGPQDIANPNGPKATVGDSSKALGIADNNVVSLGDSGYAICTFQYPIVDGPGNDFAVFENAFNDTYLELGFVEVSSDGVNFFRFPATSNTQDTLQTGSFGNTDATKLDNLGGKYRVLYGTPFDLAQMQGLSGLNCNAITHVKVIDVIGTINSLHATHDKNSNKINDPYPTVFASCGFDLDAVGVVHNTLNSINEYTLNNLVSVYPNPASGIVFIDLKNSPVTITNPPLEISVTDLSGEVMMKHLLPPMGHDQLCLNSLSAGIYFLKVTSGKEHIFKKLVIEK